MKETGIQWATHTFNPWRGCTKVSDGCRNCYAETLSKRNPSVLGEWGPNGTRVVAAEARWAEVLKWNADAASEFEKWMENFPERNDFPGRPRVFCASLADVFESAETMPAASVPYIQAARTRLFKLIDYTHALDWLLLTKRPENVFAMTPPFPVHFPSSKLFRPNVWIGTTIENRASLPRIDVLRSIPAAVRFLSCEPLLEDLGTIDLTGIHWVIVGGESGGRARPFNIDWARSIVRQCQAARVAVFVKQLGSHPVCRNDDVAEWFDQCGHLEIRGTPRFQGQSERVYGFHDRHAGNESEWPADLQVREFPFVKAGAA